MACAAGRVLRVRNNELSNEQADMADQWSSAAEKNRKR